jgi:DNA uptake protein ComE-like DNA-binding protein
VNLANPSELCEIPGIRRSQAEAIVKFRAEHGPIESLRQLDEIMGDEGLPEDARERLDFAPASPTAPEAPGA